MIDSTTATAIACSTTMPITAREVIAAIATSDRLLRASSRRWAGSMSFSDA